MAHKDSHLLTGLLFDDTGDRMSPTHANRKCKRYRYYYYYYYYVSRRIAAAKAAGAEGWRVPARELENAVHSFMAQLLSSRPQLATWIGDRASSSRTQLGLAAADEMLGRLSDGLPASGREALFKLLFRSITLTRTAIQFSVDVSAIVRMLVSGGVKSSSIDSQDEIGSATVILEMPISIKRRGNEARLIIDSSLVPMRAPDPAIIDLIAKVHLLVGKLTEQSSPGVLALIVPMWGASYPWHLLRRPSLMRWCRAGIHKPFAAKSRPHASAAALVYQIAAIQ